MAFISVDQPARARLVATKGVTIIDAPSPRNPSVTVMVISGIRCCDIRHDGDVFRAAVHMRDGEWLPLADGVTEDAAFGAVLAFVSLVASVPQSYAPEHDAAERAAAAEVYAAFAFPLPIAA
ncbi:hypothetical protein [Paracraurococcus lichenis]|uniref:Uncharacterized protein n=1 Tax=Paracraurococcus lichenis TaxID=3064888 RepID=A0ABT9ED33_9PROT|nr:hypothetical protein [Paracraurococcus sp. LOR1-02]MDO9714027.1 hypothetical protein [Paracraurococcus sp. LOR1-02]